MRRTAALLVALLLLALGGAACGDDAEEVASDDQGATQEPDRDDPLLDRELIVIAATGHDIVAGTTITLSFDGTTVAVDAGCNRLSGTYAWDGDDLVVEAVGGTEMGCDPERMEQDAWISAFLGKDPIVLAAEDGTVTLTAGEESLTLADEPTPQALPLVGTTWVLDTIAEGTAADGTAASLPVGVTAGITFAADGTYELEAGCNTGSGTYAEAGAGIYQIDAPTLTRRRCEPEVMDVETAVLAVLDGEVTASIEADRLTLAAGDAGLGFSASD